MTTPASKATVLVGARFPIELVTGVGKTSVKAELVTPINDKHLSMLENTWSPFLGQYGGPSGDRDWNWRDELAKLCVRHGDDVHTFAIEARGQLQGLMVAYRSLDMASDLTGEPVLYVALLAAAPWNRSDLKRARFRKNTPPAALRGVGEALIRAAIAKSEDLGFEGRLGLHSITSALEFYIRNCHVVYLGKHATRLEDDEHWCELSVLAARFLKQRKRKPAPPRAV